MDSSLRLEKVVHSHSLLKFFCVCKELQADSYLEDHVV